MFLRDKASEVVLIVDDNPPVREAVKAILVSDGYSVMTAADGLEAWHMLEHFPKTIVLVITDVEMPNMNGLEVCRRLKTTHPDLPVLLMSGLLTRAIENHLGERVRFVQKPINSRALLGMVRAALERSWGSFIAKPHAAA